MKIDSLRAFVVEDHAFQRGGLVILLRALGVVEIREAANGVEALALLETDLQAPPPDVILCDLDMPEMDGIEFLRAVAERRLASAVIILSGREAEIQRSATAMARASGLRVLGCLEKPPSLEGLRNLLSRDPEAMSAPGDAPPPDLGADELRRGLEAGQFHCEFQPKLRLVTGTLIGVEGLARWRRPDGRPVGPSAFVPAMVRAGLVAALTDQVLDATCRALNLWSAQGISLMGAVNLSVSMLGDVASADRLLENVRGHGIDAERITFELTETEVMADLAPVLDVMTRLRLRGFRLAIDDFGTGYASLSQLNAIPFTELKIDRSFVRHCERSKRLGHIIQSIVELARRLEIRTVAEGIESVGEWRFLARAGCDEGQGYYIAPALPADGLLAWDRQWQARRALRNA